MKKLNFEELLLHLMLSSGSSIEWERGSRDFLHAFERLVTALGHPDLAPDDLRRSFAVNAAEVPSSPARGPRALETGGAPPPRRRRRQRDPGARGAGKDETGGGAVKAFGSDLKPELQTESGSVESFGRDQPVDIERARHSSDFRSVHWFGEDYTFTAEQAAIVKMLWKNWENGTPDIGQLTLLEAVGSAMAENSQPRLSKLFQNHPAYGPMIVPGATKGSFRLQSPQS